MGFDKVRIATSHLGVAGEAEGGCARVKQTAMAEKPKFELPGQTKSLDPNAADTDALTLFYESLHKQRPDSEMASRWLLQYGLLPHDEAAKLHKELGGKVTKTAAKGDSAKASSAKRKVLNPPSHPPLCALTSTLVSTLASTLASTLV